MNADREPTTEDSDATGRPPKVSDLQRSVSGPRDGPTLLLVHPMGADATFWDECLPLWTGRFRCISLDLRGAGASPAAKEPLTVGLLADDLDAVRRDLGLTTLIPVGCAVGAMVAATFASRHPEVCSALILSNPGLRTLPAARTALTARMNAVRAGGMAASLPGAIESAFAGNAADPASHRYQERFLAQDPVSYAFQIEGMLDADTSGGLHAIDCPVLLVGGGQDRLLPVDDHAEKVRAHLPDAELTVLEEGAHFIPFQAPEAFAGLVGAFLSRRLGI